MLDERGNKRNYVSTRRMPDLENIDYFVKA